MLQRQIARVVTLDPPAPGFLGRGHTAVEVLDAEDLVGNDPFVLLMDDRVDVGPTKRQMGGAHPHAGLETVTFVLEGHSTDHDEGDAGAGDVQWMTAGRGIIHSENVEMQGKVRVLQLWVRLPARDRSVAPRVQLITGKDAPRRVENGAVAVVYSGSSGALRSPTLNHAPVTLVDFQLQAGASIDQVLPASYNGFLLVLDGSIVVGDRTITSGQTGWLDRPAGDDDSVLVVAGGPQGGRAVLYSGAPQNEPTMQHGPFVAGDEAELVGLYKAFRGGGFVRLSELAHSR